MTVTLAPWPHYSDEEIKAVSEVLRSGKVNYWTGTQARDFEREFAEWAGVDYAIALTNGTVALDLALHGLGIGATNGGSAQDEVVVTPRSFIASVSCVVNAGAIPVFADVEGDSGNLSARTIAPMLTNRTRAIIVVHLAGWPVDMDPIISMAQARGLKVIEDCAQAHGARYKGRGVGSIGDVGAWSFCQDKIMSTGGEGGMVTTSDKALWERMWSFKDHGKSWDAMYVRQHPPGFRWLHDHVGTNWRMTELQAVLGRIQLARMGEWTARRLENAELLRQALAPLAGDGGCLRLPWPDEVDDSRHAAYKFYFHFLPERLKPEWPVQRVIDTIAERGVPCQVGSCSELYRERAFAHFPWLPSAPLPVCNRLAGTTAALLIHPTLTAENMERIASTAVAVIAEAQA